MGTRLRPLVSGVAGEKELQVTHVNFSEAQRISRTHSRLAGVWEAGGRRPGAPRRGWVLAKQLLLLLRTVEAVCQAAFCLPLKTGSRGESGISIFEMDLLLFCISPCSVEGRQPAVSREGCELVITACGMFAQNCAWDYFLTGKLCA